MRNLIKREIARVLRAVAEHLDHEQRLSPEAAELLRKGCEDVKAGRVMDLGSFKKYADDDEEPKPPQFPPDRLFVPVPYPYPYPAPPLDVRPWPGYPQPYIGDWPPPFPGTTFVTTSVQIPALDQPQWKD